MKVKLSFHVFTTDLMFCFEYLILICTFTLSQETNSKTTENTEESESFGVILNIPTPRARICVVFLVSLLLSLANMNMNSTQVG